MGYYCRTCQSESEEPLRSGGMCLACYREAGTARTVRLVMGEAEAMERAQTVMRAMALLTRYASRTQGDDRIVAEHVYLALGEIVDLLERGMEQAEEEVTDRWGRPLLPPDRPLLEWLARGQGRPVR